MFPCEESRSSAAPLAPTSARDRAARASHKLYHSPRDEWLFKKTECATGLRATSNVLFGKRRDENHWYRLPCAIKLKIEAAHTLHLYVGDQTRAVADPRRAQEILSAFERESDETERLD
jgi:hypothetical protein